MSGNVRDEEGSVSQASSATLLVQLINHAFDRSHGSCHGLLVIEPRHSTPLTSRAHTCTSISTRSCRASSVRFATLIQSGRMGEVFQMRFCPRWGRMSDPRFHLGDWVTSDRSEPSRKGLVACQGDSSAAHGSKRVDEGRTL